MSQPKIKALSSKAPDEVVPVIFEFGGLVTAIDSVVSLSVTVHKGTDPDPSTMILNASSVDGTDVTQLIQGGLDTVIYKVRALVQSGQLRYALEAHLPVRY